MYYVFCMKYYDTNRNLTVTKLQQMHQFQKLTMWQKAMEITKLVYQLTQSFPEEERFGLTSQIRRAAISIPSNIAEGSGRNSPKEFNYHLGIAAGSASELFTQVLLAGAFQYLEEAEVDAVNSDLSHVLNMLYRLQASLT